MIFFLNNSEINSLGTGTIISRSENFIFIKKINRNWEFYKKISSNLQSEFDIEGIWEIKKSYNIEKISDYPAFIADATEKRINNFSPYLSSLSLYQRFRQNNIETVVNILKTIQTIDTSNPNETRNKLLFYNTESFGTSYIQNPVIRNENWWAHPYKDLFNISGISFAAKQSNGTYYNGSKNATLITPQHFYSNYHFPPVVGDTIYFFDNDTNYAVTGTVASISQNLGGDACIGKLTQPLDIDGKNIKIYKFARFNTDIDYAIYNNDFFVFSVFGTGSAYLDYGGHITTNQYLTPRYSNQTTYTASSAGFLLPKYQPENTVISSTNYGWWCPSETLISFEKNRNNVSFNTQSGETSYKILSSELSTMNICGPEIFTGDSSTPSFIIYNDDILLFTGLYSGGTSGGSGPNLTTKDMQEKIQQTINSLGNGNGYQIGYVELSDTNTKGLVTYDYDYQPRSKIPPDNPPVQNENTRVISLLDSSGNPYNLTLTWSGNYPYMSSEREMIIDYIIADTSVGQDFGQTMLFDVGYVTGIDTSYYGNPNDCSSGPSYQNYGQPIWDMESIMFDTIQFYSVGSNSKYTISTNIVNKTDNLWPSKNIS